MIFLSLTGIYASWRGVPYVMFAVFLGSFFPLGLYMLGNPIWVMWIGVFNLLYLISAVFLSIGQRSRLPLLPAETSPKDPTTSPEKQNRELRSWWWLAALGGLMGLAACGYEAYVFCSPHLVHYSWETAALGAYILFFGAALAGGWRRHRRVVLAAGVMALGLTALLFVIGLVAAFAPPDYVPFLPGSLLVLLAAAFQQK